MAHPEGGFTSPREEVKELIENAEQKLIEDAQELVGLDIDSSQLGEVIHEEPVDVEDPRYHIVRRFPNGTTAISTRPDGRHLTIRRE